MRRKAIRFVVFNLRLKKNVSRWNHSFRTHIRRIGHDDVIKPLGERLGLCEQSAGALRVRPRAGRAGAADGPFASMASGAQRPASFIHARAESASRSFSPSSNYPEQTFEQVLIELLSRDQALGCQSIVQASSPLQLARSAAPIESAARTAARSGEKRRDDSRALKHKRQLGRAGRQRGRSLAR